MNNSTPAVGAPAEHEAAPFDAFDTLPDVVRYEMNYASGSVTIVSVMNALAVARKNAPSETVAAIRVAAAIHQLDVDETREFASQFEERTGTPYPHTAARASFLRPSRKVRA